MGSSGARVDDSGAAGYLASRRMSLFIAVISLIIVSTLIVSSYHFVIRSDKPVEEVEELDPRTHSSLWENEKEVLSAANAQLVRMELGNIQAIDQGSPKYKAKLFQNHNWGFLYWEFRDGDTTILVHAETSEIIKYTTDLYHEGGPRIPEEQVHNYTLELLAQFAPVPEEMAPPCVEHHSWTTERFQLENGSWDSILRYMDWDFDFNRTHEGVRTLDRIDVRIRVDGTLKRYQKDWFMDLEGFDTETSVSAEEAKEVAAALLLKERGLSNVTFDFCERTIIWLSDLERGSEHWQEPVLVWRLNYNLHHVDGMLHAFIVSSTGEPEVLSYGAYVLNAL